MVKRADTLPCKAILGEGLARIRGLLQDPIREEDPECCLCCIGEIVQEMIGYRTGIAPGDTEEQPHGV